MLDLSVQWRRSGGGGGAPAAWVPTDLGASLIAWWSADVLADGTVASWADSVAAFTLVQTTEANKPIRAAASFNSAYAGVTFDGVSDRVGITNAGTLPVGTADSEMHCVVSQDTPGATTGNRAAFCYGSSGANAARNMLRSSVASANRFRLYDTTASVLDTVTDFSGAHIFGGRMSAATGTAWIDGKPTTPASGAMTFNTGAASTFIGAGIGGAITFWGGVIRHVFVTAVLADANRQKLEGWCAHNSGLTANLDASHPYKAAPP